MKTAVFDFDRYVKVSAELRDKEEFLRMSRKLASMTAQELGLEKGSYDIRVNKAGPAVSGEVTLHGEEIYVQFGQGIFNGFLCRSCKGRKDYVGGQNHFYRFEDLEDFGGFIEFLRRL